MKTRLTLVLLSLACAAPLAAQAPPACVETSFASNNGGSLGGAVYFDVIVSHSTSFSGVLLNTGVPAGGPVGLSIYVTPTSHQLKETDPSAWTLVTVDDGTATSAGADNMTSITFLSPFFLTQGRHGIALVGENLTTGHQLDHDYTNGTGTNQFFTSQDGVVSAEFGTATNLPFSGSVFNPRVWNGRLCHDPITTCGPGLAVCGPPVLNSTGMPACMGASGSASVTANNVVLEAHQLPHSSFGFFLTSRTPGFTANPGGSMGHLCLGGSIGRYVGPGEIQNSGTQGQISLAVDLANHPTPTGPVAVAPGDTWYFTAWFRDVDPSGAPTSNFADALEVSFSG